MEFVAPRKKRGESREIVNASLRIAGQLVFQ
jgi:hypothetical protein